MVGKTHEEKMTDRIGKMIRQAEDPSATEAERELFMDRAMTLSQAHSIDMAVARSKAYSKEKVEEPEERRYQVADHGSTKKRAAHFVDLLLALGKAFDMKPLISHSNTLVWFMGYPSDHDLVSKMFTMLSVQMVSEADAAIAREDHKVVREIPKTTKEPIPYRERNWGGWDFKAKRWYVERYDYEVAMGDVGLDPETDDPTDEVEVHRRDDWGGYRDMVKPYLPPKWRDVPVTDFAGRQVYETKRVSSVDARIWRANFYAGFTSKVAQRMKEARKQALQEAGIDIKDETDERGLVLLNKKEEISDRYETQMLVRASKRGKGYGGAEVSGHSHQAQLSGQSAAANATYGDERIVD